MRSTFLSFVFSVFALLAAGISASAQSYNCATDTLGRPGCAAGQRPYTSDIGSTLGSRGNGWYTNDPVPNDSTYGARPYNRTLGTTTDSTGRPYSNTLGGSSGCSRTLSGRLVCN